MRAVFRICRNESQPGLQLVEKLATPLESNSHVFYPGATAVCGFHLSWMASKMSFTHVQSAARSLVNIRVLEWIAYGRKRRSIGKHNTIIREDNII